MADPATTPEAIELVRAFLNTIDYDDGTDQLDSAGALAAWLRARGRLGSKERASDEDLALALELRAGLREEVEAHHQGAAPGASVSRRLDAVYERLPLRLCCGAEPLAPCGDGVPGALAEIAAAVATARIEGTWDRLKICPAADCAWAFYDASRNRSRRWCSMEVCGNRSKVRAFRSRVDG